MFEDNWKITKDKERDYGVKVANDIGVEVSEGITIVKSFWHRSRGNSKRLVSYFTRTRYTNTPQYTQLDDYRLGLELILTFDPEKRQVCRTSRLDILNPS